MRIEIISNGTTSVYKMPEQVNFVGLTIEDAERNLNITVGFAGCFGDLPVQYTKKECRLTDGAILTIYQYTLEEKARVFSWKPYPDFLFYELYFCNACIKAYG